jgi:transposase-like protein
VDAVLLFQRTKRGADLPAFGVSRQTFYRWKRRFDRHDLTTLEGHSHRPRKVRQPTWTPELAERVLALRKQYPRWGKDKLVVLLRRENLIVSTCMNHREQLSCGANAANYETAHGPFASLNARESSPEIWWR